MTVTSYRGRSGVLVAAARAEAWRRMSCGDGTPGSRVYDWVSTPSVPSSDATGVAGSWPPQHQHQRTGLLRVFKCPRGTRLRTLVATAGARRAVEESFQIANNEAGRVQYP
ncbi:MAG TPA: hypothetical protein VK453_17595 [Micromonosporaceae bacterium]|nr:hypothetical protein [Micromonosporaceae bacterium]